MKKIDETTQISQTIATNLRQVRKKRNFTLSELSESSGISKSMLGQIERGDSSPTITTLWMIAKSLHISFTSLLEEVEGDVRVIDNSELMPLCNEDRSFRLYPTFPYDSTRNFEMLHIELDIKAYTNSEAHEPGTFEYVIVYSGAIEITVGDDGHRLRKGEAIKYDANQPHSYKNIAEELTRICMVIYYK